MRNAIPVRSNKSSGHTVLASLRSLTESFKHTQALLQSETADSLTRAVIFSALTTASGFGSLILSSHPGTASMGHLLIISLGWTLFTTLFFLPALLGKSPEKGRLE